MKVSDLLINVGYGKKVNPNPEKLKNSWKDKGYILMRKFEYFDFKFDSEKELNGIKHLADKNGLIIMSDYKNKIRLYNPYKFMVKIYDDEY